MSRVYLCKMTSFYSFKASLVRCKPGDEALSGVEPGDLLCCTLVGSKTEEEELKSKLRPKDYEIYQKATTCLSKIARFEYWSEDINGEYAQFRDVSTINVPLEKFLALDLFKLNDALMSKPFEPVQERAIFELLPDDPKVFFDLVDTRKILQYATRSRTPQYRRFARCLSLDEFDSQSRDIQFCVTDPDARRIVFNTAPSFLELVRDPADPERLTLDANASRLSSRSAFWSFIFENRYSPAQYYSLFKAFWKALDQKPSDGAVTVEIGEESC